MICIISDVPADPALSDADKRAAVGKILVKDTANQKYVVGGDATAAAGNKRGAGYCLGLSDDKSRWTVLLLGVADDVLISAAVDVSANGNVLSFTTTGTIIGQAAGENACGELLELQDAAAGGAARARVFFNFQL